MELLERPAYLPLWRAARRRVEANGLSLKGTPLTLRELSANETDAIAGLLGIRRPAPGSPLRVSLTALDRALRSSSVGRGLLDVLSELDGPIIDRAEAKRLRDAQRVQQWSDLVAHPAVADDLRLAYWLDKVRARGVGSSAARRQRGG